MPGWAGTISGIVKFEGTVPAPKVTKTGKYKIACGEESVDDALMVDHEGVQNVVVWLSGKKAKKLKSKPGTFTLNQEKCRYVPRVLAMPKGSEVEILTSDPINHNIHTYSFENDPINLMFTPGQEHVQEFEEPETIKVECDLHGWMKAWIVITPNSYYAVSGKGGNFEIKDVPPGKYTLTFWHETLGELQKKVEVTDGVTKVEAEFEEDALKVSKK
jgi:plastocyanin